ncbi:MAG: alpha/beta fold hydrolase [Chloroflexi bacterium]|nr:alpha/beta fold hydrolase [Chloroflexota bacterium]MCI0575578.1 alpha/beta fold hydrolase [Chloroflexota bacterium]MCI0648267.1 alpha/beta fold hydrolase [Chloroflexota bacterium]MCI0728459.1 alpha/beta fold hydrolase [Chloroflexota bacterium]
MSNLEQYTLERNGCPIHYWLSEKEERPLVVLTHGAGADHQMFDAQVTVLDQHYSVLIWDVRGHGLSRPIGDAFSIHVAVADLLAILDGIGRQQAIFAGQSQEFTRVFLETVACLHYEPGYTIPHPLLITHGDHDRTGNIRKVAPRWAQRDPQSRYLLIPQAGHCANQDNPEFFNRVLLEFLEKQTN